LELFNIRHGNAPSDAVNIMRPGPWGNPFPEKEFGRDGCISLYEHWLFENPGLVATMRIELANKDLVCCCWPKQCHGNVIMRILKGEEPQPLPDKHPLLIKAGKQYDPVQDLMDECLDLLERVQTVLERVAQKPLPLMPPKNKE
jgi:hypothetical protein